MPVAATTNPLEAAMTEARPPRSISEQLTERQRRERNARVACMALELAELEHATQELRRRLEQELPEPRSPVDVP